MKRLIPLVSGLVVVGLAGIVGVKLWQNLSPAQALTFPGWPKKCEELKRELADDPVVNVTAQSPLAVSSFNQLWALNYQDKRIPIPAIAYKDLVISGKPGDRFLALVGELNGQRVLVAFSQVPNSIQQSSEMEDLLGTRTGDTEKALVQQLFDPEVRLFDLIKLGWQHQLSDLKCQAETAKQDAPIAIALILKAVASPNVNETTVAYTFPQGQALMTQTETEQIWLSEWVSPDNLINQVTFKFPKNQPFGTVGLGINDPSWTVAPDAPAWLKSLETVLGNSSPDNIQALLSAAKAAKLSEKSINAIETLLQPGQK